MLQISDLRETRVYQDALQEGREEGKKEQAVKAILNMAAKQVPLDEIASFLEVDLAFVKDVLKTRTN
jgi:predicted transposase YdaD